MAATQHGTDWRKRAVLDGGKVLTENDRLVLNIVFEDLAIHNGKELPFIAKGKGKVILVDRTKNGPGWLLDSQLDVDLRSHRKEVTPVMRRSLVLRNQNPVSLNGFKVTGSRIVVVDQSDVAKWFPGGFDSRKARMHVETYLPGYSDDGLLAVVRFWFGPSPHGATGTYFLTRARGAWKILWREFSFYV